MLVADDQPEHLEMIVRAIERSQLGPRIEVVRAEDGILALALARRGVDAAFLDIRMPGRSGLEVAAAIRAEPRLSAIPIVIVSSSSDPRDLARAHELQVTAYVEKGRIGPFRARIEAALETAFDRKPL